MITIMACSATVSNLEVYTFFVSLRGWDRKKNQGNLTLFDLTNSPYGCVHVTNGTDEEKFVCTAFENFYRGASLIPKPCWRKHLNGTHSNSTNKSSCKSMEPSWYPPNTVPNEPNQDQILDRFAKLESRFVSLIVFVINRLFDL